VWGEIARRLATKRWPGFDRPMEHLTGMLRTGKSRRNPDRRDAKGRGHQKNQQRF
jgi:hypothetical protein